MSTKIPGEQGFVLATYTGKSKTERDWIGPITGATYVFGDDVRMGLVDVRDAELFTGKLFDMVDAEPNVFAASDQSVDVRVVSVHGASVLVEYKDDGLVSRCYVPRFAIEHGSYRIDRCPKPVVPVSILTSAIEYGTDFAKLFVNTSIDAIEFAKKLRQSGIWTIDDYQSRSMTVYNIINGLVGLSDALANRKQSR